MGVAAAANTPGGRYCNVTWSDASGNFWIFGGYGYDGSGTYGYLNDLWKYDIASNQWTWLKGSNTASAFGVYGTQGVGAAGNNPGARYGGTSWMDGSGNLWLFGGYGAYDVDFGTLNDLWKYNPATNQWTWMKGNNGADISGVYGTQGVAAAGNKPGSRFFTMGWIDGSGKLWLFGGSGYGASAYGDLNDVWKYDPSTNNWTWIKGVNTANPAAVFGTQGTPAAGNTPGGRNSSVTIKDASGNFWLFGGDAPGGADMDDLWQYNTSTNQWTWMKGDNTGNVWSTYGTQGVIDPSNQPGGREFSGIWFDASGNLWVFGAEGYAQSSPASSLNDLWKLSNPTLPVTLTNVKAYEYFDRLSLTNGINVQWTFSQEIDMDRYEVEKSTTGMNFSRGGSVVSSGNHSSSFTYNWREVNPTQGANFYRIKMIGKDGKVTYSQVVKVVIAGNESISIYPNPVVNNSFAFQLTNKPKGNYDIRVLNAEGKVVYKSAINHNEGSSTQTIQLPLVLAKGIYNLEVADPLGKVSVKLVVQ
jgi:hypothetical protein